MVEKKTPQSYLLVGSAFSIVTLEIIDATPVTMMLHKELNDLATQLSMTNRQPAEKRFFGFRWQVYE